MSYTFPVGLTGVVHHEIHDRAWSKNCSRQKMTAPVDKLLQVMAAVVLWLTLANLGAAQQTQPPKKLVWNQLVFAIVKFNDQAPKSWNIYHSDKKGVLLVRVWKRYLLVDVTEQEVYDIDPQKVTAQGDAVEWSFADMPEKPIDTPDWTERNVGTLERVRFRLGKDGYFLELQLPLGPNGRPIY